MDLHFLIGTGGAPLIERIAEFIKVQFKLNGLAAAAIAVVLAVGEQYGLSRIFHFDLPTFLAAVSATLGAVFAAHEITTN